MKDISLINEVQETSRMEDLNQSRTPDETNQNFARGRQENIVEVPQSVDMMTLLLNMNKTLEQKFEEVNSNLQEASKRTQQDNEEIIDVVNERTEAVRSEMKEEICIVRQEIEIKGKVVNQKMGTHDEQIRTLQLEIKRIKGKMSGLVGGSPLIHELQISQPPEAESLSKVIPLSEIRRVNSAINELENRAPTLALTPSFSTEQKQGQNKTFLANLVKGENRPTFSGGNPIKFIGDLEIFMKLSGVSEKEIVENMHLFLKGKPENWWRLTVQEGEKWLDFKNRFTDYWYNRQKVKELWRNHVYRPNGDVEGFVLKGLELRKYLKGDANTEDSIKKVVLKLPSPLKEFLLKSKCKNIKDFLAELKEMINEHAFETNSNAFKSWQMGPQQSQFRGRSIYNAGIIPTQAQYLVPYQQPVQNYGNWQYGNPSRPYGQQSQRPAPHPPLRDNYYDWEDSTSYNWDSKGNAYNPEGVCIWTSKLEGPRIGKKYINMVSTPSTLGPQPFPQPCPQPCPSSENQLN